MHETKFKQLKRYTTLIIGMIILSATYNLLLLPNNLVTGGLAGVAIIFKDLINPNILILVVNIILIIISFLILGKNKTKDMIIGALLFPLFTTLTKDIGNIIVLNDLDLFLTTVFSAVLMGFSIGIIMKNGFSTGGADIMATIISHVFKRSIGNAFLIVDGIIIIAGGFVFGIIKTLYAIIFIYIYSIVTDKILLGISNNKAFYIVTDKELEVKDYILKTLSHGATILKAVGGYENEVRNIIFCVVPSRNYFKLKEGILAIDNKAFFMVTDAYEVQGGA